MRELSRKEIKRALRSEVCIPDVVENRIEETYRMIGAKKVRRSNDPIKRRKWAVLAATAVFAVSTSVIALGANGFFTKDIEQKENKVAYKFNIEYELTPYDVEVQLRYLPEGFKLKGEDSPRGGKIINDKTGANLGCYVYNAAQLDEMNGLKFENVIDVKKMRIRDMEAHIVTEHGEEYTREILLFNEQEGYVAAVYCMEKEMHVPLKELEKVAEQMEITKLSTQTAYMSKEEKRMREEGRKNAFEKDAEQFANGVPEEYVREKGEKLSDSCIAKWVKEGLGTSEEYGDIRFTVLDVEVKDSLPLSEFGREHYPNYDRDIKPWVKADGTLKARERRKYDVNEAGVRKDEAKLTEQNVKSKYVLVKLRAENMLDTRAESVFLAPRVQYLQKEADGHYSYPKEMFDTKDYGLQYELPIASDAFGGADDREGQKEIFIRNIEAKETLEYTLVYVADEDRLADMYVCFFADHSDSEYYRYVKVTD